MTQKNRLNHRKKRMKKALLLSSLVFLLTVSVGGTLAYLVANSSDVTNTFTPGTVPPGIVEEFDGSVKKQVKVKNTGTVDAYLRAAIVYNWVDKDGNISGSAEALSTSVSDVYGIVLNDKSKSSATSSPDFSYWRAHDGYYYWPAAVKPGDTTEDLIISCKIIDGKQPPAGCTLSLEIITQSIQANGTDADGKSPMEVTWGVKIDPATGEVTSVTPTNRN